MDVSVFAICTLLFSSVVTLYAWKVLNLVWFKPKRLEKCLKKQGLKGSSYRLFNGDLKENNALNKEAKSKPINLTDDISLRLFPFTIQNIKNHGKDSYMWIGPTPRVNIINPENIREVFTKIGDFPKPQFNPLQRLLATGITSYEGHKWAKHRRTINPAFHTEKLKRMVPAFHLCCDEMLTKWESLVSTKEGKCEVDIWPDLQSMTADVISRTAFGSSYQEGRRIFQLINQQAELVFRLFQFVYIPGWRFMPTKSNNRMKEIDKEVRGLLKDIIKKREKAMRASRSPIDDLLGILMESNLNEIKENGNKKNTGLSVDDVIEECKIFYLAGQETTANLLVWTMVLLSRFPDWQTRAREEVLEKFGDNTPDYDGLAHLKVVTLILYEVLRTYPPVTMVVRTTHKETQLGNMLLPGGTELAMPTLLVHYDTQLWGEDAKEFKPERFAEGVSKATKGRVCFFPFGWGPRICIGQNFAMIEAKMALASILQRFTFELSPSYSHAPLNILTLQPQFGAHLILHKH